VASRAPTDESTICPQQRKRLILTNKTRKYEELYLLGYNAVYYDETL
jgi:hypothetical protein